VVAFMLHPTHVTSNQGIAGRRVKLHEIAGGRLGLRRIHGIVCWCICVAVMLRISC
jgi:hypothetical protein